MMISGKDMVGMWTWMASFGFLAMIQQFIPKEYTDGLRRACRRWFQMCTPYIYCDIPEYENSISNSLYQDVEMYISSLRVEGAQRLSLCKSRNAKAVTFQLANDQRQVDTFDGAKLEWVHSVYQRPRPIYANYYDTQSDEKRLYILTIHKKDKERVLNKYMAYIEEKAVQLKLAARELLLYTNTKNREYFSRRSNGPWQSVPFKHPANFSTLALDGALKKNVLTDLDVFSANEDYYKRIGKAWKRGYLLYGPPGTGKSSMIAAIANKMRYDVYDLELMEVTSNTELRKLLLSTSNKAVIVIEDIDCSLDLSGQRKKKKKDEESKSSTSPAQPPIPGREQKEEQSKVTLSGLLNFVDGLWSCCGAERIFIFTTNYKEKLDPALLRAGRMDMHIHLSYCTFSAFKQLAENYLQISEHELYEKLEATFEGSFMTPAEVSEVLILNQSEDVDVVLEKVMEALDEHRVDPEILKKKEEEEAEEEEKAAAAAAAEAKAEADKKAKESPPTDVPEDKQQVAEIPPPPPNPAKKVKDKESAPPPKDSTDSAENVELKEPQKIETESDDLKGDLLLVKGEAEANQLEKDVVDVKEIPDVSKAVMVTNKGSSAKTDSGGDESSGQLQAVKVKES